MLDGSIIQFLNNPDRHPDSSIAVYATPASRVTDSTLTPAAGGGQWWLRWAARHTVGAFERSEVDLMLGHTANKGLFLRIVKNADIRWRASRA